MNANELMISPVISEVAFEEGRRLAADPNICAVGYGAKLRGGRPVGDQCVVFMVREKLSSSEDIGARGSWPVPPSVSGFVTDVVEVGQVTAAAADRSPPTGNRASHVSRPLIGGTATMGLGPQIAGAGGYGTIGGRCFDNVSSAPLLLSNAHVWGQTVGTDVAQPVTPVAVFGAAATRASVGTTPQTVLTRIPSALAGPVTFANSVAQTYLIAGGDSDPLPFGQGMTPEPSTTRTDSERVAISAPSVGIAPAGKRLAPVVSWQYKRFATTAVLQASSEVARTHTKLLAARRLFTNAASYTAGQTVNLYGEIIPPAAVRRPLHRRTSRWRCSTRWSRATSSSPACCGRWRARRQPWSPLSSPVSRRRRASAP